MAYDLAMDVSTSDIIVQGGDLMIVDNAERVAQQVLITLREWLGEWFLKTSDGIPYLEYILVKNPNEAHIRQIPDTGHRERGGRQGRDGAGIRLQSCPAHFGSGL